MSRRTSTALAALLLGLVAGPALGACSTSADNINFGTYDPVGALPGTGVGNVRVSCSGVAGLGIGYTISLSPGASGGYAPRRLYSGANTLDYNLYSDALYTSVWGDGSGGSSTVSGTILLQLLVTVSQDHAVYGRIPTGQDGAAGSYSDTITVTVEY